jgi:hypothetical protein
MTDHGSIFFSWSRARRGPRDAAAATVARTFRTASPTWDRAVPACAVPGPPVSSDVAAAPEAAAAAAPGIGTDAVARPDAGGMDVGGFAAGGC